MSKSLSIITLFFTTLFASNQIAIIATIPTHANTQMKMIHVDNKNLRQDVYLQTNYKGLIIALSDSVHSVSSFINNRELTTVPINFSDEIYDTSTRIGELIISQKGNKGSLGVTISVK
jgi:hypothetical protein